MTCRMAAGQQRKQLRNPNLHEQRRTKKKRRLDSSDNILCLSSQVNLEWNASKKAVVAKKEQIGLAWTDMLPFVCSVTKSSSIADVVSVPSEIFGLDNLSEVLTYEVWTTYLSEPERKFLSQFLPSDSDIEKVVHSLLMGENHHFGSPYLKWSSSLCVGNLHPDVVLHTEKKFKFSRRASYYEINKYHTDMLEDLKKWRERWLNCKDSEKLLSEEFIQDKRRKSAISAESAKLPSVSKGEMSFNHGISNSDSIKYLSCIKLTRSQFQLVKNLKFSGDGIQRKSLIHLLGDVNSFHVQSYDKFEAEEKKKLHEHWLLIATEDIPNASRLYKESKMQKEHCLTSLGIELTEKRKLMLGKDKKFENLEILSQESAYGVAYFDQHKHAPDVQDDKDVKLRYKVMSDNHLEHIPSSSTSQEIVCAVVNDEAIGEGTPKQDDGLLPISVSLYRHNACIGLENSNSSMKDIWPSSSLPNSSYHHSSHEYLSVDELSLERKQIHKEHQAHILDMERHFPESGVASSFDKASIFCPSISLDHNEMLPAFPNGSGLLPSYAHEQINNLQQPALPSCMTSESLPGSGQFASQFQGQTPLLQQNRLWQKGSYMHQTLNRNVYSTERYPSKGHFLSVDQQGFSAIQSSENIGSLGYNWFPAENQAYNHWSGVDSFSSNHCVSDEGNANGNLSSVFSSKLLRSPFDTVDSEQYAPARNFVCGALPATENPYSYAQTELANLNSDNTTVALSLRNGSLMRFPLENPGFQNLGSKQF